MLASGSLPPQFPATAINGASYWDGGIVDNTPLGDAIAAFSPDGEAERFLVVMNLFRKERPLPKNMIEVNDRLARAALRQPDAAGQQQRRDHQRAGRARSSASPRWCRTARSTTALMQGIARARRFKVLEEITDIDLADPALMAQAGLATASEQSGGFRDFSRRRDPAPPRRRLQARRN